MANSNSLFMQYDVPQVDDQNSSASTCTVSMIRLFIIIQNVTYGQEMDKNTFFKSI